MTINVQTPIITNEEDLARVAATYQFRDQLSVNHFLHDHPGVVATLGEAAEIIPRFFGHDVAIELQVAHDPEALDDVELIARIQTDLSVDEALARLRRFDQEWWLDALPKADGALTITIEYR